MKVHNRTVLVIDDDTDICFLLQEFLRSKDFIVETAHSGKSGLSLAKKCKPDMVLCDFRLPDIEGLDMLKALKEIEPSMPVVIITGYSDVKLAVKAIKQGAHEYVTKPLYPEEILITINDCFKKNQTSVPQQRTIEPKNEPTYVEGSSQNSVQMHNLINMVAPTNMTCLLIGESGTGKEYVAHKLHKQSNRADKPFVAVDCGALGNDIAASELFGHVKGAFTGAHANKKGHFEEANGGTLFLDEIGNLSYENQVKLLRVLQERVVSRVGESKSRNIDIRLIAATNANLAQEAAKGEFREDLYHRLNEFKIDILPLRSRREDIEQFAHHFMNQANSELNKNLTGVSSKALHKLQQHSWPGNLRELKNVMKRAVLMEQTEQLQISSLPTELGQDYNLASDASEGFFDPMDLKSAVEQTERRVIKNALKQTNFNKSQTAQMLGIDRKTLYNKLNQYELNNLLQEELQ